MTQPWIDLRQYQGQEGPTGPGFSDFKWQAIFACQIGIPLHQEWAKLKWGFNALALFDEAMERQRLFLESQYIIWNDLGTEMPNHRTLAFRFIRRPGEDLLIAMIGKIHAKAQGEASETALTFLRELASIFPYDYTLVPAMNQKEFIRLTGEDILNANAGEDSIAQIKRVEIPIYRTRNSPALQGLWQSSSRAHEQIWRSLADSSSPLLLNISLRSTVLYEKERDRLLKYGEEIANASSHESHNLKTFSTLKQWNKTYTERRLNFWEKFFYLQIHLVSTEKIDEARFRSLGAVLTLSKDGHTLPGYQVVCPKFDEGTSWRKMLKNLDVIFSASLLPVPRLSEVADLEEVFAAIRIPYSPPENGFPNMNFAATRSVQD